MAAVRDVDVELVRATLAGSLRRVVALSITAIVTGPLTQGASAMTAAAFTKAAVRQFSPTYTMADVVRFVARVRVTYPKIMRSTSPLLAEFLILRAIGGRASGSFSHYRRIRSTTALLQAFVAELELDDAGIAQLLAEARPLADTWLERR